MHAHSIPLIQWLRDACGDLWHTRRILARSPGFAVIAILTLALGIGANTAVFSIINGSLLRPLPYRDPSRLIAIWDKGIHDAQLAKIFASYRDYDEFQRHARSVEHIAAATWATGGQTMTGRGLARHVLAIPVSAGFFSLFGVAPARGRIFTSDDLKRGCSVVLSDRFWRGVIESDPLIAGKSLVLDKKACTVLGVMPPRFAFYPEKTELWTLITPDFKPPLDKLVVGLFARLRPGVSMEQAQAELTALHSALHKNEGWYERDITPITFNMQSEFTWMAGRNLRTTLWVLLAAVTLVLMIACLNVANLLLGRSLARRREMAVRTALGAGHSRLIRQLLAEGLLLSLAGGAIGIAAAFGATAYFRAANPIELPVGADISISLPVLAFTVAISIATALMFALLPAWKASVVDINDTLKSSGHGSVLGRGHQKLVKVTLMAQVSFSVVLLAGAGLLMQSVLRMGSAPLGFDSMHVLTASLTLPSESYADVKRRLQFFDELTRRLSVLPGVQDVALSSGFPPFGGRLVTTEVQGIAESKAHDTLQLSVSNDYFRLLKVAIRSGRVFNSHDTHDSEPVAVVNQNFVDKYFPNRDAIGRRVRIPDHDNKGPWLTIVGVTANEKHAAVYQEMAWVDSPAIFQPTQQDAPDRLSVALRTSAVQASLGPAIEREVAAIDANIPAGSVETLDHSVGQLLAYPRFRAVVFAAFALFSLLLAAVGLHGILQQFVAQRTQEIGVRMAIGASIPDIVRLVAAQGGVPVIIGLLMGLGGAIALGRTVSSLLYGVHPTDPFTLLMVAIIALANASIAISIPASRAARVDPMIALRYE